MYKEKQFLVNSIVTVDTSDINVHYLFVYFTFLPKQKDEINKKLKLKRETFLQKKNHLYNGSPISIHIFSLRYT